MALTSYSRIQSNKTLSFILRSLTSLPPAADRPAKTKGIRKVFEQTHYWTPPVFFPENTQPPSALQWLRRRGPQLPNGLIQQLFRKRRVRVFTPQDGSVERAGKDHSLTQGSRILIPKQVAALASTSKQISASAFRSRQLVGINTDLRNRVLYQDNELLVLNKPPGLAVQGGSGIRISVDWLAEQFLRFRNQEPPRLVHRLDRETSGAIVLARTPDAAAWLSAAFGQPSQQAAGRNSVAASPGVWVKKVYWAIVEADAGLPAEGIIQQPLVREGTGQAPVVQAAITSFAVQARTEGLAWLKLNPITGRKHQLRLHCAKSLHSPIKGDTRYGSQTALQAVLEHQPAQDSSPFLRSLKPSIHLHCRSLQFKQPGKQWLTVTAPLPPHMEAEFTTNGWRAADGEGG